MPAALRPSASRRLIEVHLHARPPKRSSHTALQDSSRSFQRLGRGAARRSQFRRPRGYSAQYSVLEAQRQKNFFWGQRTLRRTPNAAGTTQQKGNFPRDRNDLTESILRVASGNASSTRQGTLLRPEPSSWKVPCCTAPQTTELHDSFADPLCAKMAAASTSVRLSNELPHPILKIRMVTVVANSSRRFRAPARASCCKHRVAKTLSALAGQAAKTRFPTRRILRHSSL